MREWFNEIQRENLDNASLDSLKMDSVQNWLNETTFDDTSISEVADFDQLQRYGSSNRVSNRSRNMRSSTVILGMWATLEKAMDPLLKT